MRWIFPLGFAVVVLVLVACFAAPTERVRIENYPNFRVHFIDDQVGWIIGPRLLRTVDGGHSWEVIKYARPEDAIRANDGPEYRKHYIDFVDRDWGWRISPVELNAVEYTENGGRSWSHPIRISLDVHGASLVFVSRQKGWVLGEHPALTRDGGRTWQEVRPLAGLELKYPYFLDAAHGWLANEWGVVARTTDGGESWSVVRSSLKDVRNIFFRTPSHGWVAGDDGLLASTNDGGVHWVTGNAPVSYDSQRKMRTTLLDVFFLTPTLGWISGYDGTVLGTIDGGQTWTRASTPTHAPLSSIRFIDALHGWAVGGYAEPAVPFGQPSNVIIETTDGGQTWRTKTLP